MNEEPEQITQNEEEHEEQQPVPLSLGQQAAVFVPTAAAVCGLDAALHAPLPLAVVGLVGAYYLTRKSPTIYEAMREHFPLPALAKKERAPGQWSLMDRLLDRHMQVPPASDEEDGAAAYLRHNGVDEQLIASLLGTSNENDDDPEDEDTILSFSGDDDDDLIPLPTDQPNGIRVFSDLLKTGWRPSMEQIYVGTDNRGRHLFVPVASLWHVALAGATGYGKSSLLRLLLGSTTYVEPVAKDVHTDELENATSSPASSENTTNDLPETAIVPNVAVPEVVKRDVRRKAEDIDLNIAVALWNGGFQSRAKLAKALDIAENQADKLMVQMGVKQSDGRMDG